MGSVVTGGDHLLDAITDIVGFGHVYCRRHNQMKFHEPYGAPLAGTEIMKASDQGPQFLNILTMAETSNAALNMACNYK